MPKVLPPTTGTDAKDDGVPQRRSEAASSGQLALQHVSSHHASLALARWRSGISQQEWTDPAMPASQARWHAQLQNSFVAWLEVGGFQQ